MNVAFISGDWGSSFLRLCELPEEGPPLGVWESSQGVLELARGTEPSRRAEDFRRVLTVGLAQLRAQVGTAVETAPVVISGMASSSIGWRELPYARLPLALDGSDLVAAELEAFDRPGGRQRVMLLSGARTDVDVMRGEETQALGAFQLPAIRPLARRARLILPGTHSKHLSIESERIVDFQTFMTGELFEVLSRHSILQHSLGPAEPLVLQGETAAAFHQGLEAAVQLGLSAALFRVRTRQVLDNQPGATNRAFLSGAVIGAELASLTRQELADVPLVLGAAEPLADVYAMALGALGLGGQLVTIAPADVGRLSAWGQAAWLRTRGVL